MHTFDPSFASLCCRTWFCHPHWLSFEQLPKGLWLFPRWLIHCCRGRRHWLVLVGRPASWDAGHFGPSFFQDLFVVRIDQGCFVDILGGEPTVDGRVQRAAEGLANAL